ncbi:hypothetical protein [uncultured Eubacterium sp.]|uniref:hypothetical protein n=1 Tax=uncultured Eubacterium sp. TaxID=165185 RepID=UPI0025E53E3F|nr:hypothetical protein [uncultured Eubacterium sp.]
MREDIEIIAEKIKTEIAKSDDLRGMNIAVMDESEPDGNSVLQIKVDDKIIVYRPDVKGSPEVKDGVSVRNMQLPYESADQFAKRVVDDIKDVTVWKDEEHSVDIWIGIKERTPLPMEEELKKFMEEKLKSADLHGYSVDVQFSISKSKKIRCSALCRVYKHDRKDERMVENILCCYSNDDKWMTSIDSVKRLYDNITHLNHCENLDDMKAAVEQNIDEISSKMEERRRILYAISDERYKKNILQEYVDDRLQVAGVADKAYANVHVNDDFNRLGSEHVASDKELFEKLNQTIDGLCKQARELDRGLEDREREPAKAWTPKEEKKQEKQVDITR